MYGDADVTVSVSRTTVAPVVDGDASFGMTEFKYLNDVTPSVVLDTISLTTKEPL